jgi:hypothetical protein
MDTTSKNDASSTESIAGGREACWRDNGFLEIVKDAPVF